MLGARAQQCMNCKAEWYQWNGAYVDGKLVPYDTARELGLLQCGKPNGCWYPMPQLDEYSARVLEFFCLPSVQSQWEPSMESPIGIPRDRLEVEARARRIVLSEFFLDKFAVCELALRKYWKSLRPPTQ